MTKLLEDRVIWVVGASGAIGAAIAREDLRIDDLGHLPEVDLDSTHTVGKRCQHVIRRSAGIRRL